MQRVNLRSMSFCVTLFAGSACTSSAPVTETEQSHGNQSLGERVTRSCGEFPDLRDAPPRLGVELPIAQAATRALSCAGRLPGYSERCPDSIDSKSGRSLCPAGTSDKNYPNQQVFCGSCVASRAEMLAFGVHMLADVDTMVQIQGCAAEGRCEGWKLCSEAGEPGFTAQHWLTSYVGWAIAPGRGFFRGDGQPGPEEQRPCRPHDAALWIEAATVFARMSKHQSFVASTRAPQLGVDYDRLKKLLQPGCRIPGVEGGGQWWIPATVALNNHGLFCLSQHPDGLYTANICGVEKISDCTVSRAVLATISARMRGDVPLAECEPISLQAVTCSAPR